MEAVHAELIHPGHYLKEYMYIHRVNTPQLAEITGIATSRLYDLINGKRNFTVDISIKLGKFFKASPHFCLEIQSAFSV